MLRPNQDLWLKRSGAVRRNRRHLHPTAQQFDNKLPEKEPEKPESLSDYVPNHDSFSDAITDGTTVVKVPDVSNYQPFRRSKRQVSAPKTHRVHATC